MRARSCARWWRASRTESRWRLRRARGERRAQALERGPEVVLGRELGEPSRVRGRGGERQVERRKRDVGHGWDDAAGGGEVLAPPVEPAGDRRRKIARREDPVERAVLREEPRGR